MEKHYFDTQWPRDSLSAVNWNAKVSWEQQRQQLGMWQHVKVLSRDKVHIICLSHIGHRTHQQEPLPVLVSPFPLPTEALELGGVHIRIFAWGRLWSNKADSLRFCINMRPKDEWSSRKGSCEPVVSGLGSCLCGGLNCWNERMGLFCVLLLLNWDFLSVPLGLT